MTHSWGKPARIVFEDGTMSASHLVSLEFAGYPDALLRFLPELNGQLLLNSKSLLFPISELGLQHVMFNMLKLLTHQSPAFRDSCSSLAFCLSLSTWSFESCCGQNPARWSLRCPCVANLDSESQQGETWEGCGPS